jgi:hypothetical protein
MKKAGGISRYQGALVSTVNYTLYVGSVKQNLIKKTV